MPKSNPERYQELAQQCRQQAKAGPESVAGLLNELADEYEAKAKAS